MDAGTLVAGYRRVLTTLYDPTLEGYFETCLTMLEHVAPNPNVGRSTHFAGDVMHEGWGVLLRSTSKMLYRLLCSRKGPAFLRFLARVARRDPRLIPEAGVLAAMGYHFEKVASQQLAVHDFKEVLKSELDTFRDAATAGPAGERRVRDLLSRLRARYRSIHPDFRPEVEEALESFRVAVGARPGDRHHRAITH